MRRDTRAVFPCKSSFLSCQKDIETILKRLFVESYPHSDALKRLLVINTPDCLENDSDIVKDKIAETGLPQLIKEGYVKLNPKIRMPEHEEIKAYILISMDNFTTNAENSFYRDCTVSFDIICHIDYWDVKDYRLRPLQIAGYIDGLLNDTHLSGIGLFNFIGCNELILDENLAGYTLTYRAIHGYDDKIPPQDEE